MKALVFEKSGVENLRVEETEAPKAGRGEVLVRVKLGGVNPIDEAVIERIPVKLPHVPGAEVAGIVAEVGEGVTGLSVGEAVTVYNRIFDGNCDMCVSGKENLCRHGGIMSVVTDGGYRELYAVPAVNAIPVGNMPMELAASLPTAALSAYHALKEAALSTGETLVVLGATGNTGRFATQLGRVMGAQVIAVSREGTSVDGADASLDYSNLKEEVSRLTGGRMADVVLNSVGRSVWDAGISVLGTSGRLATFGVLTGGEVGLNLSWLYGNQVKLIGTTGGTKKEMLDLVKLSSRLTVRVWKKFSLEEAKEAFRSLHSPDRSKAGRAFIQVS
ncbi:MAG: alcohol dehydrogenase catalytic domain-containing protein [Thermoprotei archaeon]|nr:alcohol dehydrogenase catalytic domain-containing protein [TACK group archaeon]